eukprot:TRINITY_DN7189_c0_g1_i1.p1 TRINITY_DN7189_c0_g1~~TRINITY_DN7189_c0_g1_i1.p1  ORF type:complete len:206 (-),score=28.96 TRINITY_DN7189_c0_g1_i1:259-876(-)
MMRAISRLILTVPSNYLSNRILAQKTFHSFVQNGTITSHDNKYETPFSNYESFRKYGMSFVSIGLFSFTILNGWKKFANAEDNSEDKAKQIDIKREPDDSLLKVVTDIAGESSLGGVLGFSAGYALKKVGKIFVFGVGALFVIIQILASRGYLSVNWLRVAQKSEPHLTKEGQKKMARGLFAILLHDFPLKAGFVSGFVLGWKYA